MQHFIARLYIDTHPPIPGFPLSVLRYFSFEWRRYISSHPAHPIIGGFIINPHHPPVHHIYIPTYTTLTPSPPPAWLVI